MNKPNVSKVFKDFQRLAKKRSPEILTGIGIAGMVTTVVLAVKATPKAMELIEEEKLYKEKEAHEGGIFTKEDEKYAFNLTPVETIKAAWKPYVPAVMTGAVSVACLIGANSVHARRNAALYSAYKISTTALTEYRDKVVETIGEKKEAQVREKVNKDKLEKNPSSNNTIIMTGGGETLCYDAHSDRYFKSDVDKIKRAVFDLNDRMQKGMEMYISLNEFYDEIGLKHTDIGDSIGWRIDKGYIDVSFGAQLTDKNEPCIVVEHLVPPEYGFDDLY